MSSRLSSLAIRLRRTLLSSWPIPRYIHVLYVYEVNYKCWLRTKLTLRTQLTCTFLHTPAHTQTGMRATKVKVEHMEDRLYIHHNYCLQDINGKTGLEHLTSLEEIKARPNLHILTEYQKWVDEQSDLVDAIMGMYQLDKSSENADVEDEEKEELMSTWVNSLTI